MEQNERAFQRQPQVFANGKRVISNKKGQRYCKDLKLGFKAPIEAQEGTYIDKKCPFTSDIRIRGRILTGVVRSTKMKRTIVIRREYLHFIKKYNRYEKRHKNISAHCSPCFAGLKVGDTVTVGECRPLSKTVRFNVIRVDKECTDSVDKGKQFLII